uniref:Uncharacterized protein n=1 Tax=Trichuris muris TaxID=70415 RepID=A0A5S6Q8D6_TRIMR
MRHFATTNGQCAKADTPAANDLPSAEQICAPRQCPNASQPLDRVLTLRSHECLGGALRRSLDAHIFVGYFQVARPNCGSACEQTFRLARWTYGQPRLPSRGTDW